MSNQISDPKTPPTLAALAAGQAALWISESLMLALVEREILDKDRVLEAVDIVISAKQAIVAEGGNQEIEQVALGLLAALSASIASANLSEERIRSGGSRRRRGVGTRATTGRKA
jgi:hypothetical protein